MVQLEEEKFKLEQDRLELDRTRFADEQRVRALTLELERARVQIEGRFANKHLATLVTGIVSLAAVIVSVSQVFVAYTSKEKEIEVAQIEQNKQREMTAAQQRRDWNLKAVEFVATHQDLIFGQDAEKRTRIVNVMLVTFPPEITSALFQKLADSAVDSPDKRGWIGAQSAATKLLLVRLDGLYQSLESDCIYYLRFYPDGTVLEVCSPGAAEQVARWLVPESSVGFSRGKVEGSAVRGGRLEIQGTSIKFSTSSSQGEVDYEGTVSGDAILLNSYSHINGVRSSREYHFTRLGP